MPESELKLQSSFCSAVDWHAPVTPPFLPPPPPPHLPVSPRVSQEYVRHLNSVVQGEYRDRVIVVHPQLRLYTRALGVFDALKGKVEMTAPRFKASAWFSRRCIGSGRGGARRRRWMSPGLHPASEGLVSCDASRRLPPPGHDGRRSCEALSSQSRVGGLGGCRFREPSSLAWVSTRFEATVGGVHRRAMYFQNLSRRYISADETLDRREGRRSP